MNLISLSLLINVISYLAEIHLLFRMDSQSKYLAWKEERRQIDEARINRQRTAPGRWIREWDRNKVRFNTLLHYSHLSTQS